MEVTKELIEDIRRARLSDVNPNLLNRIVERIVPDHDSELAVPVAMFESFVG